MLLGGNLGNVKSNFEKAETLLGSVGICNRKSAIYRTQAWGMPKDSTPPFLNQVVILETKISPQDLLKTTREVEKSLGREWQSKPVYSSRPIDIDILFWGDEIIEQANLKIPHERLHLRRFTLEPLCELMGGYIHPVFQRSLHDLLENLNDDLEVERLNG